MPTTAPAIRTKTSTRVIPFLRSEFSPKKWPALKRKPIRKMTPRIMGKIVLIVSETSLTESSMPPIWAKVDPVVISKSKSVLIGLFMTVRFLSPSNNVGKTD
tara:strand:- start:8712 stop:9017 length:306 start_codon:yes stop_codon:yes gene_type:complete